MARFGKDGLQRSSTGGSKQGLIKGSPRWKDPPKPVKAPNKVGVVGRKKTPVDYAQVTRLARIQCTVEEVASVIGISRITLDNDPLFVEAYNKGIQGGKKSLRRKQFEIAVKQGNPSMLMFLGNHYLGQVPKSATQLSGEGGGPIKVEEVVDLRALSTDNLETLRKLLQKAGVVQS